MDNLYAYIGPPGCGKTEALKKSVAKNVGLYGAGRVLCCSLTVNAAGVLRGRVELPERNVGTLHSFCFRELGNPEMFTGRVKHVRDFSSQFPQYALSGGVQDDNSLDESSAKQTLGDRAMALADVCRARRLPIEEWPSQAHDGKEAPAADFYEAWCAWKKSAGVMDFTDLLERCLEDVEIAPGMPAVIIGDEAQDWSKLALSLLLKWGKNTVKTILAADANQAIFAFAGAEAANFLSLPIKPENRFVLDQSYRLPVAAHALAQSWIKKATVRESAEFHPRKDEHGVPVPGFVEFSDYGLSRNFSYLCDRAAMYNEAGLSVMFIAACGYQVRQIASSLKLRGLPFHNPLRPTDPVWNPLRDGSIADRARAFLAPRYYNRPWKKSEAASFLEMIPSEQGWRQGVKERTLQAWKKDSTLVDAGELLRVLDVDFVSKLLAFADNEEGCLEPEDMLMWLNDKAGKRFDNKMNYPALLVKNFTIESLRKTPMITIGTIHSLKGAEADIVFVVPDVSYNAYRQMMRSSRGADDVVRCFYVAITRCRCGLIICAPASDMSVASPDPHRHTPSLLS